MAERLRAHTKQSDPKSVLEENRKKYIAIMKRDGIKRSIKYFAASAALYGLLGFNYARGNPQDIEGNELPFAVFAGGIPAYFGLKKIKETKREIELLRDEG
jgi:hypothetical protein